MKPVEPEPVKLFAGILYTDARLMTRAADALAEAFGQIDHKSPEFNFDLSDYYRDEMGWPIFRKFFSFKDLINPEKIAGIKIKTNEIEARLAVGEKRKINLDPGYMDYNKVVLASAKFNAQKIYLSHGIYADPTLRYENGGYHPYPFSFPDFQQGNYDKTFLHIRALFKGQKRKSPRSSDAPKMHTITD